MRIAVTGARGQLGAAIVHECSAAHEVVGFGHAELDIADEAAVGAAMARVNPDVIVNAAAFTNVDAAEDHPVEALNSNAFGVRALARTALTLGAALVHYSTDFVFDGKATSPYTELDRPSPQGVYAASKLLGEWFTQDAPRSYVLRVEGIFGETPGARPAKGSAAGILNGLKAGAVVKVFEDRIITPSYAADVARATRRLIETQGPYGLYHCVNSGATTWYEFALEMARLIGVEPRLTRVRMADMNLRAIRPVYCALSNDKLRGIGIDMPTWQDALARYLSAPPAGA